jgi:hypothetical protein
MTVYITLIDGFVSSYFVNKYCSPTYLIKEYTPLSFKYDGVSMYCLHEIDNYTLIPMSENLYNEYVTKLIVKSKNKPFLKYTFKEVWTILLTNIINKTISKYKEYGYNEPTTIKFATSYLYVYTNLFNLIKEILPELQFNHQITLTSLDKTLGSTIYKDFFNNIGKTIKSEQPESQIHSFLEIGVFNTVVYTYETTFDESEYKYKNNSLKTIIPTSSKLINVQCYNKGLYNIISDIYPEDLSMDSFWGNFKENVNRLSYFNSTNKVTFEFDQENYIYKLNYVLNLPTFVSIIEFINNILLECNSSTLKIASYSVMHYLNYYFRDDNGTSTTTFTSPMLADKFNEGSYIIINPFIESCNEEDYTMKNINLNIKLNHFNCHEYVINKTNVDNDLFVNYVEDINRNYQELLHIKSIIQKEKKNLSTRYNVNISVLNKYYNHFVNISHNNGAVLQDLWNEFKENIQDFI